LGIWDKVAEGDLRDRVLPLSLMALMAVSKVRANLILVVMVLWSVLRLAEDRMCSSLMVPMVGSLAAPLCSLMGRMVVSEVRYHLVLAPMFLPLDLDLMDKNCSPMVQTILGRVAPPFGLKARTPGNKTCHNLPPAVMFHTKSPSVRRESSQDLQQASNPSILVQSSRTQASRIHASLMSPAVVNRRTAAMSMTFSKVSRNQVVLGILAVALAPTVVLALVDKPTVCLLALPLLVTAVRFVAGLGLDEVLIVREDQEIYDAP
jgi:hypothetical protein